MNAIALRKLGLVIALLGASAAAGAAEGKPAAPAEAAGKALVKQEQADAQSTSAIPAKSTLTREQVMEDLRQYQREHANPSYSELVFLR